MEYNVLFVDPYNPDGYEECLIVLPSFWKLLLFLLRRARRCRRITIIPQRKERPGPWN